MPASAGAPQPGDRDRHASLSRFPQPPLVGPADGPSSGTCKAADLFRRSALAWLDGRLDTGLRYAAASTDVECDESHEACELAPYWHITLLTKARELEAGWRMLTSLEARRGKPQSPRMIATSQVIGGDLKFAMGRVDDGLAEVDAGLRLAEQHSVRSLLPIGYVAMALGALRRADMRTCLQFVDKLAGEAVLGYFGQSAGAWVTAQATEARGGVDSAAGLIAGIVTNPPVLRQLMVSEPAAASWLTRAAGKLGADDLATTTVTAARDASVEHLQFSVIRGAALHSAGLVEEDATKLLEAVNLYPDRWCAASAREDLAALLTKRGADRDNTVRILESALSTYSAVGATRDASRVVNKLRDFGVRRGTIRTLERDSVLPHGLTNTEFAVAELVSQGHTNSEVGRQLFISRHTVAFHLKKVYQKMNITSRVELAASWKEIQ